MSHFKHARAASSHIFNNGLPPTEPEILASIASPSFIEEYVREIGMGRLAPVTAKPARVYSDADPMQKGQEIVPRIRIASCALDLLTSNEQALAHLVDNPQLVRMLATRFCMDESYYALDRLLSCKEISEIASSHISTYPICSGAADKLKQFKEESASIAKEAAEQLQKDGYVAPGLLDAEHKRESLFVGNLVTNLCDEKYDSLSAGTLSLLTKDPLVTHVIGRHPKILDQIVRFIGESGERAAMFKILNVDDYARAASGNKELLSYINNVMSGDEKNQQSWQEFVEEKGFAITM